MLEPATKVITICGGFKAVAEITGRDQTRVRRWTYPKDKGGTGGTVPVECQQMLIDEARKGTFPLKPEHFFPEKVEEATE